jgi:hypothetical protein
MQILHKASLMNWRCLVVAVNTTQHHITKHTHNTHYRYKEILAQHNEANPYTDPDFIAHDVSLYNDGCLLD